MASDFRFVPPYPEPLSGPSMLEQIEQGINGAVGDIDGLQAQVDEALANSANAQTTANSALQTAQSAETIAQAAQNQVTDLAAEISNITIDVTTATDRANAAYDMAATAQTAANTAQATAEAAQATAETAQTTAETAQAAADEAQTTADQALTVANEALGEYLVVASSADEIIDANNYLDVPSKIYVTGSYLANFPEVAGDFYFGVYVNSANSSAYQVVFLADDTGRWTRSAVVTEVDGTLTGTWTPWISSATPNAAELKDLVLAPITLNSEETNIDLGVGLNGDALCNNVGIAGLPVASEGYLENRSDTSRTYTSQRYTTLGNAIFLRHSTTSLVLTPGFAYYRITVTSGDKSVDETLIFQVDVNGILTLRAQLGSHFSVNASATSGIIIIDKISFYIDDPDYINNGYTLTITDEQAGGTQNISLTVAAGGAITVNNDTADSANSYLIYQSGESLTSGGTQAEFYLSATWTNYTGSPSWVDWVQVSSSTGGDTVPSGIILMWAGTIDAIPPGWVLCDGTSGTPDLSDKFVMGAVTAGQIGATGGTTTHVHPALTANTAVALTTEQMPSHAHTITNWQLINYDGAAAGTYGATLAYDNATYPAGGGQPHTHPASTSVLETTVLPPYYKLAFIQKV